MMKNILKLEAVEVPYRTSPDSLNDLNSGALDYAMYPRTSHCCVSARASCGLAVPLRTA
jgi:hypothetical protein